ncbi:MAG: carbohydrate-binding domain-containing protein [Lachnospiraceae bacterium]|nr:carbohydrate-binding domain-containing protein [Lachnospiraceae bacterium]
MRKGMIIAMLSAALVLSACGQETSKTAETEVPVIQTESYEVSVEQLDSSINGKDSEKSVEIDASDLFTDRDMQQTPDLADAEYINVSSGKDITIDSEGIYVLSGNAKNVTVIVEADDKDKIQLVLNGMKISNSDEPCIYVKNADKVFVTSAADDNELSVSGSFSSDGDTNTDAAIFSKDDLVLNGTGVLKISSSDNGISGKDDIKVTGGTIEIACTGSAIEAHDEILIADGTIEITACNDGLHAEDDDDDTAGSIYIGGGSMKINADDDAIHATTTVTIDDGDIVLTAAEGIEGTQIVINGGNIDITASDDGINSAQKSSSLKPLFEMNGGNVSITMGAGDTDCVDSNGDIVINGGTISISGQSTFDYDGNAEYNGGTIIENGVQTNTITNQVFEGHGGRGGMGTQNGSERNEGDRGPQGGNEGNGEQWGRKDFEGMPPEGNGREQKGHGGRRPENRQQ